MKKFLTLIFTLCIIDIAHADSVNINWYVDDSVYTTSTCTVGGDITLPTAPNIPGHTFLGWKPLYTRIEYIESTGTQYIDTNIFVDAAEFRIVAKFIPVGNPSGSVINMLCGTVVQSAMDAFIYDETVIYLGGNNDCIYTAGEINNKEIVYDGTFSATSPHRSLTGTIDGVAFSKHSDTNPIDTANIGKNVRIFGHGDTYRSKIKLKSMKIYKYNELVFNGVPYIRGDTVGLYDLVSDTFFTNAGTGNFIAGPIVAE